MELDEFEKQAEAKERKTAPYSRPYGCSGVNPCGPAPSSDGDSGALDKIEEWELWASHMYGGGAVSRNFHR